MSEWVAIPGCLPTEPPLPRHAGHLWGASAGSPVLLSLKNNKIKRPVTSKGMPPTHEDQAI